MMTTVEFTALYQALWAMKDKVTLCVRHYVHHETNSTIEKQRLSGYGVQLAVKSTEYRAVDDTKVKEGEWLW